MNIWYEIFEGVRSELSDIPDVTSLTRVSFRLFMACLLGGILGFEREHHGKSAGVRTHMLVAIGSAIFVMVPEMMGGPNMDITRVIQGLVAGIGFLGAGSIIKGESTKDVKGLTTAANIWLTAAIGMTAGLGREVTAIVGTIFAITILTLFHRISDKLRFWFDRSATTRSKPQEVPAVQSALQRGG